MSEILKSRIIIDNLVLRIDSEYFKKKYLIEDQNRSKFKNEYLGDIAFITDGQHGYHEVDENSPIRHLTAKNAKGWFANDLSADRIAKWVDDNNKRSSLCKNDLILSTRGTVGLCAIVDNDVLPANIDQDVARIEINKNDILPSVVLTYLNSQIGQDWLERNQTGMVQQGIALWRVREIPLPVFSIPFQNKIDSIIKISKSQKNQAKTTYSQAETLLLQSIGLHDFKPSTEAVNIKSFKDSFETSGRLDAEYYQKKYEDYISLVQKYPNGWQTLNNACTLKDSNFNPDEKTSYKYIELSDIGKTGDITGCTTAFGSDLPSRARRVVNTADVVISSIEGSLGSCAMVQPEYNNALCSTGFYVINSSKINAATLLVLFKSEVMQNILKQGCSGTILTAINKNEFLNMPVPLLEQNIQNQVAVSIEESFRLKKQSEHLLEVAKKAVEMAIEEGEERAMQLIYKFLIETEKPEMILMLSVVNEFPNEVFDEMISDLNSADIFTIPTRFERQVYACAIEWSIPTAVVIGLVLKSYADGVLKEAGKDHYQLLKSEIKKLVSKIKDIKHKTLSTKGLDPNNNQSKVFSIEAHTKSGKPIKFLLNNDVSLEEWDSYVDSAIDLMQEHYNYDENQLQRKIEKLEQPISSPIFWTYNRANHEWEPFDLKRDVRLKFESEVERRADRSDNP